MAKLTGNEFYDQEEVFERYTSHRKGKSNPNECIEKPIIRQLIQDIQGNVLDLGCGYGDLASEILQEGASQYTGIDASEKMINLGKTRFSQPEITLIQSDLETWNFLPEQYDWVIARLVLHYIEDLKTLFHHIHQTLKPGGTFLFSVEHPNLTSSMDLPRPKGKKTSWTVDQYFDLGPRNQSWMGNEVVKYHRNMEEYWRLLKETGFSVEELREGCPDRENFDTQEEYERRKRIPLFLIMRAQKT